MGFGSLPPRTVSEAVFATQAVPALGSFDSPAISMAAARTCKPVLTASGADITVTLQASYDGGVTWVTLASAYTAGAVGAQATVSTDCVPMVRLHAANAHATLSENVSASMVSSL